MKHRRILTSNRVAAILTMVLGIYIVVTALGFKQTTLDPIGPSVYPTVLGVAIIILSVLLFIIPSGKVKEEKRERGNIRGVLVFSALAVFFIVTMDMIGFIPTAFLFLLGFTFYFRTSSIRGGILFSIVFTGILYVLFRVVLGVLLPEIPWI